MPAKKHISKDKGKKGVRKPDPKERTAAAEFNGEIEIPTSLNEELTERIKDNPNRFIGCGG